MDGVVRAWVDGWVVSRGAAPPEREPWGFTVDVGLMAQVSRHVFEALGADVDEEAVRKVADGVTGAGVWLKVFQDPEVVGAWLGEGWWVDPEPGYLMTIPLTTTRDERTAHLPTTRTGTPKTEHADAPTTGHADVQEAGRPDFPEAGDTGAPESGPTGDPETVRTRAAQGACTDAPGAGHAGVPETPQTGAPEAGRTNAADGAPTDVPEPGRAGVPVAGLTSVPDGYRMRVWSVGGVRRLLVAAPDGSLAARGQVAPRGATAVFDQIETAPAHRRRGLGSIVMRTLQATAAAEGAETGVLAGTPAGRALYESLGWHVEAPLTSAKFVGPGAG
jgi:GNAT superfamily N-acetyltransferase